MKHLFIVLIQLIIRLLIYLSKLHFHLVKLLEMCDISGEETITERWHKRSMVTSYFNVQLTVSL